MNYVIGANAVKLITKIVGTVMGKVIQTTTVEKIAVAVSIHKTMLDVTCVGEKAQLKDVLGIAMKMENTNTTMHAERVSPQLSAGRRCVN